MSPSPATPPASNYRFALIFCIIITIIITTNAASSRPQRNMEVNNVADAVKYLQNLDSYYMNAARPRFGKRTSVGILQLLKGQGLPAQSFPDSNQEDNQLTDWQKYLLQI